MTNTCKTKKCGCADTALTTASPCPHDVLACPNPEPCPETFSDCCIIHNGDSYAYVQTGEVINPGPQFTVYQGERLCDTFQRFINYYFCGKDNNVVYGLKSKNITATSLTVSWTPLALAFTQEYEVFYCPVAASPLNFISAGTVAYNNTTPSVTITGLIPNTSYYVYVLVNTPLQLSCPSVSLILTTKIA